MCLLTPLFFYLDLCECVWRVSTSLVPCPPPPPPETQGGRTLKHMEKFLPSGPACLSPLTSFSAVSSHPLRPLSLAILYISDSDRRLSLIVGEISGGTCRTYSPPSPPFFSGPHLPSWDQHKHHENLLYRTRAVRPKVCNIFRLAVLFPDPVVIFYLSFLM